MDIFTCKDDIEELGETIACIYITKKYDINKDSMFMKMMGFRDDLKVEYEGILFFFQDEEYLPECECEGFIRIFDGVDIWRGMPAGKEYDFHYRVISDGVICISFIGIIT